MTLFLSIVIPAYNSASTINIPLSSLASQTDSDFEVIIVDDCSDDTPELKSALQNWLPRLTISYVRHSVNLNGAVARNTGIGMCAGQITAFLDSDDYWMPNRVELIRASCLTHDLFSRNILGYGSYRLLLGDDDLGVKPTRCIRHGENVFDYCFYSEERMQTSTFYCSTALARRILFDARFSRHQDSTFAFRAQALGCSFVFMSVPTVVYRFPRNGLRARLDLNRFSIDTLTAWLSEYSCFMPRRSFSAYCVSVYGRVLFLSGRYSQAFLLFCSHPAATVRIAARRIASLVARLMIKSLR
jgi:amylovoran biosynthesis glycosyltransferase AmsB